jgi:sirohydrochlorin ferrochelatase
MKQADVLKQAILIVDHGSRRAEANEALEAVAVLVKRARPDAIVRVAHMDLAPPSVADAFDACVAEGALEVIVHPYFLSPGSHTTNDIPRLVREAALRHPGVVTRITDPLGTHPKIAEVILERIRNAKAL